jgi:hypothetical protein
MPVYPGAFTRSGTVQVAPGLHGALLAAKLTGHTHVQLDGRSQCR